MLSSEPSNGMLLFFLGISIGIMSTVLANKREVDKLNGLLKQTENLVQDLHDELEMKEMLSVKELVNEDYQSLQTDNRSSFNQENIESSSEPELLDEFIKYDLEKPIDQRAENPELMSKIEAELEAELERLELTLKAESLERISDFVEVRSHLTIVELNWVGNILFKFGTLWPFSSDIKYGYFFMDG